MISPIQNRVLNALGSVLRPLAKALMAVGIGYREFAEVSKRAFIDVALSEYGIRGRPTNNSRIAVVTGLSRKEVARLRNEIDSAQIRSVVRESPASIILHHWHNDPDYCDVLGNAKVIPFLGQPVSFTALVAKYAGDIPAGAIRSELKRMNAVAEDRSGFLTALKKYFVPAGLDDRLVIGFEDVLASAMSTMAYNCDPRRTGSPRFQRVASVGYIDPKFFDEIRDYTNKRLTEFGLDYCAYLNEYEVMSRLPESDSEAKVDAGANQIGIGLFYYENDS